MPVTNAVAKATQNLELAHKAARVQIILQSMIASLNRVSRDDIKIVLKELHQDATDDAKAVAILEEANNRDDS